MSPRVEPETSGDVPFRIVTEPTLYVLGAGASAEADIPVNNDLLPKALTWWESGAADGLFRSPEIPQSEWSSRAQYFARRVRNFAAEHGLSLANPEEIMTLAFILPTINAELIGTSPPGPQQGSPLRELTLLLYGYLWDRSNAHRELGGATCYREFVELLSDGDVVLTFNYDFALELALLAAGRDWSYGPGHKITVVKPHGSISWVLTEREVMNFWPHPGPPQTGLQSIQIQRVSLPYREPETGKSDSVALRWLDQVISLFHRSDLQPIMVPPLHGKLDYIQEAEVSDATKGSLTWGLSGLSFANFISMNRLDEAPDVGTALTFEMPKWRAKALRAAWQLAFDTVGRIAHRVVIGYSLPEADQVAGVLLEFASDGVANPTMEVVTPRKLMFEKFNARFGSRFRVSWSPGKFRDWRERAKRSNEN